MDSVKCVDLGSEAQTSVRMAGELARHRLCEVVEGRWPSVFYAIINAFVDVYQ